MEEIRSTSPRLPAGSVLGPTVTKAFCGAVADVTSFLNHTEDSPWVRAAVPLAVLLLIGFVAWRTRWSPVDLENLRQRRAFGQLLRTTGGLYRRHGRPFAAIGLTAFPIVGGLTALSWPLNGDPGRSLDESVGRSGLHVAVGELLTAIGQPIAFAVVAAVVIVAMRQLTAGEKPRVRSALRGMWQRFGRVVGAQLLATLALILLTLTVIGVPLAAKKYIDWLFIQQQILFEDRPLREAFRSSTELVRGRWWYTLRVAGVFALIGIAAGPILGFALIFTDLSLVLINVIGAVVFALLIPYVSIGQTLLYFDLQAWPRQAPAKRLRDWLRRRRGHGTAAVAGHSLGPSR